MTLDDVVTWLTKYSIVPMVIIFVLIVVFTFWPSRKRRVERDGQIPFRDDR
jgi:cbb3-type cytochrome oxidase subunit 3